jgi:hypothetical protein
MAASTLALGLVSLVLAGGPIAPSAAADGPVTVSGTGPFAGLSITVEQTTNLVNQVVHLTWSGGPATQGQGNFLQIMQCWGDDPSGPTREQCQFGGFQNQLGGWASTRQVYYGGGISDTKETYLPPPGSGLPVYVPFHSVDNDPNVETGNTNKFFDANTTNEVARGQTYADGTGESYFQMQTAREAPGLGCGAAVDDITTPAVDKKRHNCWLVVVPRAAEELPGITTTSSGGVLTSPLSVTNWAQHIAIPLQFQQIGSSCPVDATEAAIYGTELVTDAVSSWQPTLCAQTSTAYSFTQVPDDLARTTTVSSDSTRSGLGFVGRSVPADQTAGATLTYAPVTVSAIGLGFLIERQSLFGAPTAVQKEDGRRITSIRLTPRLVAKLLTQSYVTGSPGRNPAAYQLVTKAGFSAKQTQPLLANSLGSDPEFLKINPDLLPLQTNLGSALVPFIPADSVHLLWQWVNADKAARDFLDGKPDTDSPWFNDCGQNGTPSRCLQPIDCSKFTDSKGLKGCPTYVNPSYKGLALPQSVLPKEDNYCFNPQITPVQCTLDLFPYSNGFADAANAVSRGDSLARTNFNGISYSKGPVQFPGTRNLISLTDTASAERYSLTMASLRNAAGEFVQPTAAAMSKAVSSMHADASGVLVSDPTAKVSGAYPLTSVTYAVVNRAALTTQTRSAYSGFLNYAATRGQVPGTTFGSLPPGYLPLPASLQSATLTAAVSVASPLPAVTPTPEPTPSTTDPAVVPTVADTGSTTPQTTGNGTSDVSPTPSASGSPSPSASPGGTVTTQTVALTQPVDPGAGSLGFAVALLLGVGAAVGAVPALGFASRGGK